MSQTVFVFGITGTQGGAVARRLLLQQYGVQAIVRDPNSTAARSIASLGAKLFSGNYDDEESLKDGINGCSGIFLNLSPDFTDQDHELRLAKTILAIAKAAGVKHVVYTSAMAANEPQRLNYWDPNGPTARILLPKQSIEREVRNAGFEKWTILRPGFFLANILQPKVGMMYPGLVETNRFTTAFTTDTKLPAVDPEDIAKFAVAAFLEPDRFNTKEIAIASELIGIDKMFEFLSSASGRDIKVVYLSEEEIDAQKAMNPRITYQLAMRDIAQFADMDEVKSWGIPLGTLASFLEREKEIVEKTYPKLP
ncbi:hypothetical protein V1525DRAFT_366566 [Lipomyces kononenkoae]|uniref:Uncharacterized protein n=1 Tax=Lipomyces kononenkoae TaxID=34357 RepID=A0ACC3STG9_LIPKO